MKAFKTLLSTLMGAAMLMSAATARASEYPTKPISLVVPFAPGGFVHAVALMISESLSKSLGQSVVVVNQPGANGTLAANAVAKAAPDGYTLFLPTASILTISPHLFKNVQFDPVRDFTPIAQVVNTSNIFVVHPDSGIKSLKDLVERARTTATQVSYGSSGNGSLQHIAMEGLQRDAGVKFLHVPYKGIGPAITDVAGGVLDSVFADASSISFIKSGRLRALAVSPKPLKDLPGVPGIGEAAAAAGIPGYAPPALWYGVVAPKGVPAPVVAKLEAAIARMLAEPDTLGKLAAAGASRPDDPSSAAFGNVIKADHKRYGELITTLKIVAE